LAIVDVLFMDDVLEELVLEDGEVVEDGELDEDDGEVLEGYCELLDEDDDGLDDEDEDGLEDEFWSDELVCANAPQHMPAAQRNVMSLVGFCMMFLLLRSVV